MATIDIRGLDPAAVLAALHAAAVPGVLHGGYKNHPPIDRDEAETLLEENNTFPYIDGRAMFVTFEGTDVHVDEYDRRNGAGCAGRALAPLIEANDRDFAAAVGAMAGLEVPGD